MQETTQITAAYVVGGGHGIGISNKSLQDQTNKITFMTIRLESTLKFAQSDQVSVSLCQLTKFNQADNIRWSDWANAFNDPSLC